MRDLTSDPRLSPFAGAPLNASTELTPAEALAVPVGDHVIDMVARERRVEVAISRHGSGLHLVAPRASAAAPEASRWGEAASALLRTTLPVGPGDEVELRTAMLVLEPQTCLAMVKKLTSAGATLRMVVAKTPEMLTGGELLAAILLTADDAQAVLTALRRVAAAAMDPSARS